MDNVYVKQFSQLTTNELFDIYKLRVAVFVVEQKCYYQEVDDDDKISYHLMFKDVRGQLTAYARIIPEQIGRLPESDEWSSIPKAVAVVAEEDSSIKH